MAWTAINPVAIGAATKKTHYDTLWDNADFLKALLYAGAANSKLFTNAGATAPEWNDGVYVGAFSRDLSAASGDAAYTSFGFKPAAVIVFGTVNSAANIFTIGIGKGTTENSVSLLPLTAPAWTGAPNIFVYISRDAAGSDYQTAIIKSMDADGMTLTWTKAGTPTGTGLFYFMAFR